MELEFGFGFGFGFWDAEDPSKRPRSYVCVIGVILLLLHVAMRVSIFIVADGEEGFGCRFLDVGDA